MDYRTIFLKKITPWVATWVTPWVTMTLGFFNHIQEKVDHLRTVDEKYAQLAVENAELKHQFTELKFSKDSELAAQETQILSKGLLQETGMKTGRTIASFNYRIPTELSPTQLYTLGLSYLVAREDEKAAAILTSLMSSDAAYRTPKNYLVSGVLWYRLDNLTQADQNFDTVIRLSEGDSTDRYQAQARLWKALVALRSQSEDRTQFWLHDLLDHYPRAVETSWVNPLGDE